MKKILAFVLLAALMLTFAACGKPAAKADYLGEWQSDRASMTVREEDGAITVTIDWANSAFENVEWTYIAAVDSKTGELVGTEGVKTVTTYDMENADAEPSVDVEYNDGSAVFTLKDGKIIWNDAVENAGDGLKFEKIG